MYSTVLWSNLVRKGVRVPSAVFARHHQPGRAMQLEGMPPQHGCGLAYSDTQLEANTVTLA